MAWDSVKHVEMPEQAKCEGIILEHWKVKPDQF